MNAYAYGNATPPVVQKCTGFSGAAVFQSCCLWHHSIVSRLHAQKHVKLCHNMLAWTECASACRLWVLVTSSTPLKLYLFDGGVVIFGSVNKKRTDPDLPADDEV